MRRRLLVGIAALFYYSGLVALARWWTSRTSACLIILNYHRASGGHLRNHLLYLRKHYCILPAEDALAALYAVDEKRRPQQARTSLVLTFDDGYYDNYSDAFPLAKELQVPLSLYLVPCYIESGRRFWWEEGLYLVQHTQERDVVLNGRKFTLTQASERAELVHVIDYFVRHARSVAEREQFLESVSQTLQVALTPVKRIEPSLSVRWEEVREMDASGLVTFGGHTMHHPILAYLADETEVAREVADCRDALEQQLGHALYTFAYPVGQNQHISDSAVQSVQAAGFKWAMTTSYGLNTLHTDPYRLQRIEVDVDQHWLVVAAETAGLWGFFSRLRWLPFVRKHFTNAQ